MAKFEKFSSFTRSGRDFIVYSRFQSPADKRVIMIEFAPVFMRVADYDAWEKAGSPTYQERLTVLEQERREGFIYNVAPALV